MLCGKKSLCFPFIQRTLNSRKMNLIKKYVFMWNRTIAPSPFHTALLSHICGTSFACLVIKKRIYCRTKFDFIEREKYYFPATIVLLLLFSIHTVKHIHFDTLTYLYIHTIQINFSSEIQMEIQTRKDSTDSISSY